MGINEHDRSVRVFSDYALIVPGYVFDRWASLTILQAKSTSSKSL